MLKFSESFLEYLILGSLGMITVTVVLLIFLVAKDIKNKELW